MKRLIFLLSVLILSAGASAMELSDEWYEYCSSKWKRTILQRPLFDVKVGQVAIPVYDVENKKDVKPVFIPGSVKSISAIKVYSDAEFCDIFWKEALTLGDDLEWWAPWSEYGCYYEGRTVEEYEIDPDLWNMPEFMGGSGITTHPNRCWLVFQLKVDKSTWGGVLSFGLGLKGSDEIREFKLAAELNAGIAGIKPSDFINRIAISNYDVQDSLFSLYPDDSTARFEMYATYFNVKIPEPGILVQRSSTNPCDDFYDGGTWIEPYREGYYLGNDVIYDFNEEFFDGRKSVTLKVGDYDEDEGFCDSVMESANILFYPYSAKSVAIISEQPYVEEDGLLVARGYVRGTGTFKAGEICTLTAVSGGDTFDHWEVVNSNTDAPESIFAGVDCRQPTIAIRVPDAVCASAEEMKEIVVRAVWKSAPLIKVVSSSIDGGTVTGGGRYAVGAKVSLKASAAKGFVFAGWYDEEENCVSKLSAFALVAKESVTYTARFVPAEEDREIYLMLNGSPIASDQEIGWKELVNGTLTIESISQPKLALTGLPAGLKLVQDKATGAYSVAGPTTKPGVYSVTASLTNMTVKKANPLVFKVIVDNLQEANGCFNIPPMNDPGETYALSVGVADFSSLPSLQLQNPTAKLAVSGLPAGLKYNATTGAIEGVATKAGTYTVYLTVTEGKVKSISTFTIEVAALPEWAVGTFNGLVTLSNETYLGATVTISANGQATAKLTGAKTMSFKLGTYTSEVYGVYLLEGSADDKDGHAEFSIRVEGAGRPECGHLSGWIRNTPKGSSDVIEATFDADQNTWASKTLALPPIKTGTYWLSTDFSVLSVKVGAKGAVTLGAYDRYDYLAKKPVATASSQIAVWPAGEGWEGRIPYFIPVDKVNNLAEIGWIDLTISKTGEISFALPESDPFPLNWYVGTYTGRVSDHVKMSGAIYMNETMGATISVDFKANFDAKATIVWDDGTRDTYTVKMTEGSLGPEYLSIDAFFTDKLGGVTLIYDVKIRIDHNRGSIPTASFTASSSGSLYIRTYYGYDTVYYSDNLQNTQPLKKVK